MLIEYVLDGVVAIVRCAREAAAADDRDGVRRRATTRKLRRLLRRVITSCYRTFDVGGAQAPPAAIYGQADDGGRPCAVSDGAEVAAMVKSGMTAL